ncbi:flagellar biosynthesis anti-sigma factor FlgM [Gallaecimonas mangrovi]|uniref:flagellar biosynthesis anti-sigma factor FlgM n=1 Tax=Gallaecimonas mangrovi TaxID=2291597 RepID=UPI000E209CFD|nr:flagellar biosynthesis anti-sigma factor FlgM [Gallaecimonas mangrovi]
MKINSTTNRVLVLAPSNGDGSGSAPVGNNTVAMTTEIENGDLAKTLSNASDVDMDKVNQLRQAIAEGKIDLDPQKLAEAIIAMHRP